MTEKGLSRWGYAGLALFAIHLVLLFLPPIPPDVKGSLWSYLAGYLAVALLLVELARHAEPLVAGWGGWPAARRWAAGLGVSAAALALALTLRGSAPELFQRFSRENGFWEPVSLFCYLGGAVMLLATGRALAGPALRHRRFVAGLYLLLGLEEIDYFGIFGGLIGRIDGDYAGSLHDLILLAVDGVLSTSAWVLIGSAFLLMLAALYGSGYLQPRALAAMVRSSDFFWVCVGLGFLAAGALAEASPSGWAARPPTLEEALELVGAIPLLCYALSIAGRGAGPTPLVEQRA